jgi:hypothetical protein
MRQGGCLALISVPLSFFVAGVLAAGALRVSVPARVGFGVILAVGGFGSALGLVATQAMTGREGAGKLFVGFSVYFLSSYLLGSALGWLLVRRLGSRFFRSGVLGLCAGALLAAAVATLLMGMHTLTVYTGAVPMSIPGAVGAAAAAWSLGATRVLSDRLREQPGRSFTE